MIICWLHLGNNFIEVNKFTICNNKIPSEFDNYTIVQISDLHNKRFGIHQSELLSKIKREHPNIIIITGDLIDNCNYPDEREATMEFVASALKIALCKIKEPSRRFFYTIGGR